MLLLSNGSKNGPRTHFLHADGKIKHAHFAEVKQDFQDSPHFGLLSVFTSFPAERSGKRRATSSGPLSEHVSLPSDRATMRSLGAGKLLATHACTHMT